MARIVEWTKAFLLWPVRQVTGFGRNLAGLFTGSRPKEVIPPSLWDLITWVKDQGPLALGFGTAEQQVKSSIALAIVSILSSIVTLGLTLAFLLVWAATFSIGVLRLVPFLDRLWVIGE